MTTDVHAINAEAARLRSAGRVPTVRAGQARWRVPTRWWEPEDYAPERVVVQKRDDGWPQWDPQRPEVFGLYAHSDEYGHLVYVRGIDCYATEDDAKAEMARRTAVLEAAEQEWASRLVDKIRANPERNWLEVFLEDMDGE